MIGNAPEGGEALWTEVLAQLSDGLVIHILVEHVLDVLRAHRDDISLQWCQ